MEPKFSNNEHFKNVYDKKTQSLNKSRIFKETFRILDNANFRCKHFRNSSELQNNYFKRK